MNENGLRMIGILLAMMVYNLILVCNSERIEDMSSGYVTEKEIIYHYSDSLQGNTIEYVLYVNGEYTNPFNQQVTYTKEFYVDKETYTYFDIGDYFNSANILEREQEEIDTYDEVK